ncbi:MAG: hypothetical protein ACI9N9_000302 [Enterobacterales bacterium]|jgi:hypothetical protein
MTQQFLNPASTAPNDKLGDTPNSASDKINANTTELYTGVAANAQAIIANTALITGFTETYHFYDNDTATAATPIVHGAGAATTYLTNDTIGPGTRSYNPNSKTKLWDSATNKFDFTSLKLGDVVDFRFDLLIDHGAAQEIDLFMSLAEGGSFPYELKASHNYYKTASTGVTLTAQFILPITSQPTLDNPARPRFSSLAAASVVVNGWFYKITEV